MGTLLAFVVPVAVVLAVGIASPPRVTALGRDALRATRNGHQPADEVDVEELTDGRTLSWAVALHGATVLVGTSLLVVGQAITTPASKGGGGEAAQRSKGVGCGGCGGGCGG